MTRAEVLDPSGPTRVWVPCRWRRTRRTRSRSRPRSRPRAGRRARSPAPLSTPSPWWPRNSRPGSKPVPHGDEPARPRGTTESTSPRPAGPPEGSCRPRPFPASDEADAHRRRRSRPGARDRGRGADGRKPRPAPIYEWIVENTFRDPKVRGCGRGDIRSMLETRNLGGKCADLNALYVALAAPRWDSGPRRVRHPHREVRARLQEPRAGDADHHQGPALPRRGLSLAPSAGCPSILRTCARSRWRSRRAAGLSTTAMVRARAPACSAPGR